MKEMPDTLARAKARKNSAKVRADQALDRLLKTERRLPKRLRSWKLSTPVEELSDFIELHNISRHGVRCLKTYLRAKNKHKLARDELRRATDDVEQEEAIMRKSLHWLHAEFMARR